MHVNIAAYKFVTLDNLEALDAARSIESHQTTQHEPIFLWAQAANVR